MENLELWIIGILFPATLISLIALKESRHFTKYWKDLYFIQKDLNDKLKKASEGNHVDLKTGKLPIPRVIKSVELFDIIILKRIQLFEEEREFTNTNKIEADKRTFARHLLDEIIEDYECGGNNVETGESNCTIYGVSGSFSVRALTAKMIEARKYVDDYIKRTGMKPTYRKIAEDLGIKSTAAYHRLRGYRQNMERRK